MAEDQVPTGTEAVLLVEDDVNVRRVTRRMLLRLGYRVYEAGGGAEARRVLDEMGGPPDLVLCDVRLSGEDGVEVVGLLRERLPGLKAILTSGSLDVTEDAPGDVPFLAKPFTLESLARVVRAAIDADPPAPDG